VLGQHVVLMAMTSERFRWWFILPVGDADAKARTISRVYLTQIMQPVVDAWKQKVEEIIRQTGTSEVEAWVSRATVTMRRGDTYIAAVDIYYKGHIYPLRLEAFEGDDSEGVATALGRLELGFIYLQCGDSYLPDAWEKHGVYTAGLAAVAGRKDLKIAKELFVHHSSNDPAWSTLANKFGMTFVNL
jgi:hypothetical protein